MSNIVRYNREYPSQQRSATPGYFFESPFWSMPDPWQLFEEFWAMDPFPVGWTQAVGDNLAVDMIEKEDEVIVKASLPGVAPENVTVEERNGWLSIRATNSQETTRQQNGWRLQERQFGSWQRSLRLPVDVRGDHADATLENGVLTVRLPKSESSKPLLHGIKVKLPHLPRLGKNRGKQKVKVVHGG